ncbi:ATPase [Lysobacter concretionis Ko07 = DSM 16239]|uniref:histidine kinase n=1 Tax=Lysobacter concretionis Ko07 = DSM 16239 TaxID=1122185 RepID=A0A0A0EQM7_9GAMM|nr:MULTISPECIES: PAS-domain containing protein [Lysobacter]KGM52764.1 ATPase [Lysobacter concretionis Ko07 = DSM 16239]QOD91201.1 PAS domain-containing hybrid sensor histidine kinase/response regulator [Lysobacter sp. CW239]
MIPGWILLLVSVGYVGMLFLVAYYGDRREAMPTHPWVRPAVYSLALAVYCSSWTFYGAVGSAARTGLGFLPIYLGPLLLLLFGWRILERLVLISDEQRITSIADFLSSRYGRAPGLAALVSLLALTAAIPYVALQFKAVANSIQILAGVPANPSLFADPALYTALLLAVFSILFGTRQIDATEHHHGMVLAIALESLVKLVAFIAIGIFALMHLPGVGGLGERVVQAAGEITRPRVPAGFVSQTLLAFTALLCLPRQFHVAVVECQNVGDVRTARWFFGGYLVIISVLVVPITLAGQALLGGSGISPDTYVLALPLALDQGALALMVYIGGFSAATGMVIVTSVALATMVSNDLIVPALLRTGALRRTGPGIKQQVLWVRRATILALALMAYAYARGSGGDSLSEHGLLAFAAVAQFAPALIGGLYWRGASRAGALAGVGAGAVLWVYTLLLPTLVHDGWIAWDWVDTGPLGIAWLRSEQLFGVVGWDSLTHGVFWSLLFNVGAFVYVSARQRPRLHEQLRAAPFLDPYSQRPPLGPGGWAGNVRGGDLLALAERIVGERHARRSFEDYAHQQGASWKPEEPADRALAQFTERLLAAAIGAASARLTLTSALRGSGMELGEVVALLDEANQELRFNRQVLATTLENISQGVSVVDADMRLVAWNRRYQEMFDYPDGMLYVGRPVADLLRWNAERGEMGPGDADEQVQRRMDHLGAGTPHVSERVRANGQVIELRGRPVDGGGYVTSYSDITEYKRVEQALRESNETLEHRVEQRTREAQDAQQSKTRFLAAVSHDLLQPLNAARLFTSALRESEEADEQGRLVERVDASLRAAEDLLDGLLDISRLDAGALRPEVTDFDVNELLRELGAQHAPIAASRGLQLRVRAPATALMVRSDRRLLRRALQNFLANALRYTRNGGVLIAARLREGAVELQVWDTGPGISPHHLAEIFDEFRRFDHPGRGERGLGLGLSICQRIARTLDHRLRVRARVGAGSVFSITVPLSLVPTPAAGIPAARKPDITDSLAGLRVLCIDNDREILDGMRALLTRWRAVALTAATADETIALLDALPPDETPDVALVDYHLHDRLDGLGIVDLLRERLGPHLPAALLTGDGSDALKHAARDHRCLVLTKPVKPASLRAFLAAQPRAANRKCAAGGRP